MKVNKILQVDHTECLGMYIDQELNWAHVHKLANKLKQTQYIFKCTQNILPRFFKITTVFGKRFVTLCLLCTYKAPMIKNTQIDSTTNVINKILIIVNIGCKIRTISVLYKHFGILKK